jgi:methionine synthase II (cobalamin-independent)
VLAAWSIRRANGLPEALITGRETFAPLRFVPKNKIVVLGLITTKHGQLETTDEIVRRVDEAARYLPVEQLALSPQCGFASSGRGNPLTEEEQWRKLELVSAVAETVWKH